MENLINFDDSGHSKDENNLERPQSPMPFPLLVPENGLLDHNNPFDRLEYRVQYSDDPFECLETFNDVKKPELAEDKLQDGSL